MPIISICDYCGDTISTEISAGITTPTESVDVVDQKCSNCTETTVMDGWPAERIQIMNDWEAKQALLRNFYKNQLIAAKETFFIDRAKAYFGTFYTPEIEQTIKDKL